MLLTGELDPHHGGSSTLAAPSGACSAVEKRATSPLKNRVWSFWPDPSGRLSSDASQVFETASGSITYSYTIASGRADWLNRDPIEEKGGHNLYLFSFNDAVNRRDLFGLWVDASQITSPDASISDVLSVQNNVDATIARAVAEDNGPVSRRIYPAIRNWAVLLKLGIRFWPGGTTNGTNAFVFTCKYGWIDLGHFYNSAFDGYNSGSGKLSYADGYLTEIAQLFPNLLGYENGWTDSQFTPEDLPSDWHGSHFGSSLWSSDRSNFLRILVDGKSRNLADVAGKWRGFLKEAGAVSYTSYTRSVLLKDVTEWSGERTHSYAESQAYKQNHSAWKCLCDGDKPKDRYKW